MLGGPFGLRTILPGRLQSCLVLLLVLDTLLEREGYCGLASGHYKSDFGVFGESWRVDEGKVCMKKVGYLGQNSGPIDGIYGCEFLGFVDFGVSKKGLNNILSTS